MPILHRIIALACALVPALCAPALADCVSGSQSPQRFAVGAATGVYAMPADHPRGMVVVGHGFPGTAADMGWVVQRLASEDKVIALAMDYRGTDPRTGLGWRVLEGAQDSIAAAKLFDRECPGSAAFRNIALGVSMGGDMSGIAVSSGARRASGAPLFDYWFDVAGVSDVPEVYGEATAIAAPPVPAWRAIGNAARSAMEAEFGGSPATRPEAYALASPVARTALMKLSGLRGAVIFHGVLDGLVTSDQSAQMAAALATAAIPTDVYVSIFKRPGTASGATLDSDLLGWLPGYQSPFAGHVNAVLIEAALGRLWSMYHGGGGPLAVSVGPADGLIGTFQPGAARVRLSGR